MPTDTNDQANQAGRRRRGRFGLNDPFADPYNEGSLPQPGTGPIMSSRFAQRQGRPLSSRFAQNETEYRPAAVETEQPSQPESAPEIVQSQAPESAAVAVQNEQSDVRNVPEVEQPRQTEQENTFPPFASERPPLPIQEGTLNELQHESPTPPTAAERELPTPAREREQPRQPGPEREQPIQPDVEQPTRPEMEVSKREEQREIRQEVSNNEILQDTGNLRSDRRELEENIRTETRESSVQNLQSDVRNVPETETPIQPERETEQTVTRTERESSTPAQVESTRPAQPEREVGQNQQSNVINVPEAAVSIKPERESPTPTIPEQPAQPAVVEAPQPVSRTPEVRQVQPAAPREDETKTSRRNNESETRARGTENPARAERNSRQSSTPDAKSLQDEIRAELDREDEATREADRQRQAETDRASREQARERSELATRERAEARQRENEARAAREQEQLEAARQRSEDNRKTGESETENTFPPSTSERSSPTLTQEGTLAEEETLNQARQEVAREEIADTAAQVAEVEAEVRTAEAARETTREAERGEARDSETSPTNELTGALSETTNEIAETASETSPIAAAAGAVGGLTGATPGQLTAEDANIEEVGTTEPKSQKNESFGTREPKDALSAAKADNSIEGIRTLVEQQEEARQAEEEELPEPTLPDAGGNLLQDIQQIQTDLTGEPQQVLTDQGGLMADQGVIGTDEALAAGQAGPVSALGQSFVPAVGPGVTTDESGAASEAPASQVDILRQQLGIGQPGAEYFPAETYNAASEPVMVGGDMAAMPSVPVAGTPFVGVAAPASFAETAAGTAVSGGLMEPTMGGQPMEIAGQPMPAMGGEQVIAGPASFVPEGSDVIAAPMASTTGTMGQPVVVSQPGGQYYGGYVGQPAMSSGQITAEPVAYGPGTAGGIGGQTGIGAGDFQANNVVNPDLMQDMAAQSGLARGGPLAAGMSELTGGEPIIGTPGEKSIATRFAERNPDLAPPGVNVARRELDAVSKPEGEGPLHTGDRAKDAQRDIGSGVDNAAKALKTAMNPMSAITDRLLGMIPGLTPNAKKWIERLGSVIMIINSIPFAGTILTGALGAMLVVGGVAMYSAISNESGKDASPAAQLSNEETDCLKVEKFVKNVDKWEKTANVRNEDVTAGAELQYKITITKKDADADIIMENCEDTMTIACNKDSKDSGCSDQTKTLSAACEALKTTNKDGKKVLETGDYYFNDTYPSGKDYSINNKIEIKAHCEKKVEKDGETKTEETKTDYANGTARLCVGACGGKGLCWPFKQSTLSSYPHHDGSLASADIAAKNTMVYAPATLSNYTLKYEEYACGCSCTSAAHDSSACPSGKKYRSGSSIDCWKIRAGIDPLQTPQLTNIGVDRVCGAGCYISFNYEGQTFRIMHLDRSICKKYAKEVKGIDLKYGTYKSSLTIATNLSFNQGDEIGLTDMSGANTGPHTHIDTGYRSKVPILPIFFPGQTYKGGMALGNKVNNGPGTRDGNCWW